MSEVEVSDGDFGGKRGLSLRPEEDASLTT